MEKEVENLDDHGCPKVQDLVGEEFDLLRLPIQTQDHTLLSEREAKLFGNWKMHHLSL